METKQLLSSPRAEANKLFINVDEASNKTEEIPNKCELSRSYIERKLPQALVVYVDFGAKEACLV